MKRIGYVIEEVIDRGNMEESFDYVLRGKRRKRSPEGRRLLRRREKVIDELVRRISDGSFRISGYREFTVCERGKERTIQCIPMKDRIALNAIMRVVERKLHSRLIKDTAASIKGRGGHYLLERMRRDMAADPEGTAWVYKCDIRKFYQSISQKAMMYVIRRFIKDKRLLAILDCCITMLPEGLSIGLRSSQFLGNLILSYYLDHVIKDECGVQYYRRYCDDKVTQAGSPEALEPVVAVIHGQVEKAGLEIKGNEQVFRVADRGIDFLGYITYPTHVRIRKHIKKRFARRWKRVKSRRRKRELLASFYGICKHADATHLFYSITNIRMSDMRKFGDLNLKWEPADGKKRFDCPIVPIGDIVNVPIVLEDFETGIKTKEGEDRYLVKIKAGGEDKKFFTNSEEMKNLLDQMREGDYFPVETTIKRVQMGKITKYKFT